MQKVADGEVSTPATPFATIHVDHKGPLPRQADSKFAHNHILVVVCALTRYALFIPGPAQIDDESARRGTNPLRSRTGTYSV